MVRTWYVTIRVPGARRRLEAGDTCSGLPLAYSPPAATSLRKRTSMIPYLIDKLLVECPELYAASPFALQSPGA